LHGHTGGFTAAEAQAIIPQADFHRIAEGGKTQHLDFFPFQQAHFQESLNQKIIPLNGSDKSALAWEKLIQIH
jgi:hypothetical protein